MQHVTMAEKSLLIGDGTADLLLQYAAVVGRAGSADTVRVHAIGSDGETVEAVFLLNSGTVLMVESSRSTVPEPANERADAYLRERIAGAGFSDASPFEAEPDDGG